MRTIALLSQPNTGKSTLFNGLTKSNQHVGNWPGKTVEKKEGEFSYNKTDYKVVDLPGSYSLFANSKEEIVTREFITNDEEKTVCLLLDASQLERSMFMLSDYIGINKPIMVVLNMMDVAKEQKKKINLNLLEERLGIFVTSMCAQDVKNYNSFYKALDNHYYDKKTISDSDLEKIYIDSFSEIYTDFKSNLSSSLLEKYSATWIFSKVIENDKEIVEAVKSFSKKDDYNLFVKPLIGNKENELKIGSCKFKYIEQILEGVVVQENENQNLVLNKLDNIALSNTWGKPFAVLTIVFSLVISMVIAVPIMGIGMQLPTLLKLPLANLLFNISAPIWLISFISDALLAVVGYTLAMAGFVLGVSFVFTVVEETGLMARVSYVFDNSMSKLGLQGKSVMPMLVSFGCNMGGASSARVIDTWGQRTLTIMLAWALPCAGSWGVVGLLVATFFQTSGPLIVLILILTAFLHIYITARLFKKSLITEDEKTGLIMELPPYHKPRWKNIILNVLSKFVEVFIKAFKIVFVTCAVIWVLSYSSTNDIEKTILYRIGIGIEPITMFFGLKWQMFIAWVCSAMGKESVLGVFSALFGSTNTGIFISQAAATGQIANLGELIRMSVTKPEALAFLFAFMFNIPCFMTIITTQNEIHNSKWTIKITLYYAASSLFYAAISYRVGLLIWG